MMLRQQLGSVREHGCGVISRFPVYTITRKAAHILLSRPDVYILLRLLSQFVQKHSVTHRQRFDSKHYRTEPWEGLEIIVHYVKLLEIIYTKCRLITWQLLSFVCCRHLAIWRFVNCESFVRSFVCFRNYLFFVKSIMNLPYNALNKQLPCLGYSLQPCFLIKTSMHDWESSYSEHLRNMYILHEFRNKLVWIGCFRSSPELWPGNYFLKENNKLIVTKTV